MKVRKEMITSENDRIEFYNNIFNLLLCHKDIIASSHAFSYSTLKFGRLLDVIRQKHFQIKYESKKKDFEISGTRDNLVISLLKISELLKHIGKARKNSDILKLVKFNTLANFLTIDNYELISKAQAILYFTEKQFADLRKENINSNDIQVLKGSIAEYKNLLASMRLSKITQLIKNDSLDKLYNEADRLLVSFDNYMGIIGRNNHRFYEQYLQARNLAANKKAKVTTISFS